MRARAASYGTAGTHLDAAAHGPGHAPFLAMRKGVGAAAHGHEHAERGMEMNMRTNMRMPRLRAWWRTSKVVTRR
ncbi:hypothetical protein SAMN04487980_103059 [Streptomyces sp. cf124]|nr:hypothetical protein SAMN04487980_103059 [Streptomyces sp. cf124]